VKVKLERKRRITVKINAMELNKYLKERLNFLMKKEALTQRNKKDFKRSLVKRLKLK
jgi:hypothetical protein